MLTVERELQIIDLLNQRGSVSVRELVERFDVTEVTIRRDLQKLEGQNLLKRTHGGAIRVDGVATRLMPSTEPHPADTPVDALILAPVQNRIAHTLRERALRSHIPLLAESVGFEGAIYLGADNYNGAVELGRWTGEYLQSRFEFAHVLDITSNLANGVARSQGFTDGLRSVVAERMDVLTVDGLDIYSAAYEVARDALRTHPEINVLFGVNDDLILGAIQAALDLGYAPEQFIAVNVGGEGKTIFEHMQRHSPLVACLALFPEVVGRTGIEAVVRLWAGEDIGGEIITPCAILTADNLAQFYGTGWTLDLEAVRRLPQTRWDTPLPPALHRRVSFVILFRTHEWYQTVARSMQERAREVGISLTVQDVNDDLKAEIRELRRLIGKQAADYVGDGDTIILDSGSTTINMAHFLDARRNLTVITNSAGVFQTLQRTSINLLLTGGQYQREAQALVGRGAQLYLSEIRADKLFLVAGGLSPSFGISSKNQLEAEIRRAMINAASEVVVLADHTVIGVDSHSFVADLGRVHTLITDAGIPSADRLDLHQRGIKVIVADEI